MPYKTFQNGVVLPASDVQLLMDQSVIHVANAGALTSIPTPDEGMVAYVEAPGVHVRRVGGTWVCLARSLVVNAATDLDSFPFAAVGTKARDLGTGLEYVHNGSNWFIAPGQVLASMVGPTGNTGGAGTLVGTVVSTPVLRTGQRFKVMADFSQFSLAVGIASVATKWRNDPAAVTSALFDRMVTSRTVGTATSQVTSGRGCRALDAAVTDARVTAGIFIDTGNSNVYGVDGTHLWIESA